MNWIFAPLIVVALTSSGMLHKPPGGIKPKRPDLSEPDGIAFSQLAPEVIGQSIYGIAHIAGRERTHLGNVPNYLFKVDHLRFLSFGIIHRFACMLADFHSAFLHCVLYHLFCLTSVKTS